MCLCNNQHVLICSVMDVADDTCALDSLKARIKKTSCVFVPVKVSHAPNSQQSFLCCQGFSVGCRGFSRESGRDWLHQTFLNGSYLPFAELIFIARSGYSRLKFGVSLPTSWLKPRPFPLLFSFTLLVFSLFLPSVLGKKGKGKRKRTDRMVSGG